jgi:arginase family enzyme
MDETQTEPAITLYGSGDFHHVSLALLRRLSGPVNLLVIDNHPDWMRGIPFLHCGTWVHHAALLRQVRSIFHVGGNVDFDNRFRHLAPWAFLKSGKINVLPAIRFFEAASWRAIAHEPLRLRPAMEVSTRRLQDLLAPFRKQLQTCPLYISLDKDVLGAGEAAVNWDSGHLHLTEIDRIVRSFVAMADGKLAGLDVVGDWSPVRVQGIFRHYLHWTEHPHLEMTAQLARERNERTNLILLDMLTRLTATHQQTTLVSAA